MTTNTQISDEVAIASDEVAIATARYDTAWLRWTEDNTEENFLKHQDAGQKLEQASRREWAAKAASGNGEDIGLDWPF